MLQEHQLYTKFSKCDFYKPQIQYMGHIISKKGIIVDSENIKSIEDWPTPTSVTNIRYFLGLVGYYQNFIENFSRIACPMTALKKKASKFIWMTNCEESFHKLKNIFPTAPILWIVDTDVDFIVFTNTNKEGLRWFLL